MHFTLLQIVVPWQGDVHFDDSELWSTDIQTGGLQPIDLVTVALHELGHSLGLNHSGVFGATMYPYYNGSQRYLTSDDIVGISMLYPSTKKIIGTDNICAIANYSYTISNPLNTTIIWTSTPNLTLTNQTNNSVSVIANNSSFNGEGTITATFQNGLTVTKTIWVGKPMFQINYDPSGLLMDLTISPTYNSAGLEEQGVNFNTINWSIIAQDGGNANLTGDGIYGSIQFSNSNSSAIINVAVTNSCGTENYSLVLGAGYDDSRMGNVEPSISKISNDSYEIINLSTTTSTKLKITVFDIYGKIAFKSNTNQINLSDVKAGIYIIKAVVDDKVVTQKIIKE